MTLNYGNNITHYVKDIRGSNARPDVLELIREKLLAQGVDLDALCAAPKAGAGAPRVVVVGADLRQTAEQLSSTTRDQVVMVRVDEETSRDLDAWVETGSLKSRSEAAALFIREGLRLHETEFRQLRDAIRDVDSAKQRLREKARELFGTPPPAGGDPESSGPILPARARRRRHSASKEKK